MRFRLSLPRQILLLTALFVCSLPLVTTRIYASDEVQYYAYLRSLWFDHDVSFENEYQHFYDAGVAHDDGFHETFLERQTETGRRLTFATIGAALLWSPFYAIGDVVAHVRHAMGAAIETDGYSAPYIAAVSYGSAVYGWLSLVLSLLIARRVLRDSPETNAAPLTAIVAVWIGTPLFFYMYIAPPMSHACSAFAVAVFVLTWLKVRDRWNTGGLIALGALAALMVMVREQDGLIAVGPAIDWAADAWTRRSPPLIARAALGATAFVLAYTPQLAAYEVLNGYPTPSHLVSRKMTWSAPHAFGVLLSPEHGLLFWTPLVVLSLVGLVWLALQPASPEDADARRGPLPSAPQTPAARRATEGSRAEADADAVRPALPPPSETSAARRATEGSRAEADVDAVRPALPPPSETSAARRATEGSRAEAGADRRREPLPPPQTPAARRATEGRRAEAADGRRVAVCLLLMVISQIYIAGSVESWTVAGAFGQRRFVGLTSIFVIGLAVVLVRARVSRAAQVVWATVVVAMVWWNLGLMAQFGAGLMDRQRLELGRNAYQTFVTIPARLPELAYRYLFERRSFYKSEPPHEP
jgi:hypothetical protein